MSAAKKVIEFYVLCNSLKDLVRTGWKVWRVKRERLEGVAEHIYGVQMLAIAMWSEYQYSIDLAKVILMIAVHELEEIKIGDLIPFEITPEEKKEIGHKAVERILSGLLKGEEIKDLVLEYDARETSEAKFAFQCDKLEAGLQTRFYDEEGDVDLASQPENKLLKDSGVMRLLQEEKTWSGMWLKFNEDKYGFDENFFEVSEYARRHKIINT